MAPAESDERWKRPRMYRGFLWEAAEYNLVTPSALSTETAPPFPSPPQHELDNPTNQKLLREHPELFRVTTPFKVREFAKLLQDHPNRPLVLSFLRGLQEGFWPYSDTELLEPDAEVKDNHRMDAAGEEFVRVQAQEEMDAGRYSRPFTQLYPGMRMDPIGAVPKPHSDGLRLINNHSDGEKSLNSYIPKAEASVRYDNLADLGRNLLAMRARYGASPAMLWKSDIAHAFRCLPIHPCYQMKQVVKIPCSSACRCPHGYHFHVDHCCCFGDRGSVRLWCTAAGLIAWISMHVYRIESLLHYMDDFFSADRLICFGVYDGYAEPIRIPDSQVRFLKMLDRLGVPHKRNKQISGTCIDIIGFNVDCQAMTITYPTTKKEELAAAIRDFLSVPSRKHPLRAWQSLIGWANWALNVFPLGRPALTSSYAKIRGKEIASASVWISLPVQRELRWLANQLMLSDGVHIISSRVFEEADADLTVYCDASPTGMGIYIPRYRLGYFCKLPEGWSPPTAAASTILWNEAACVACALDYAASSLPINARVLVYTDSMNSVDMFSSLRAAPEYNDILLYGVGRILAAKLQHRVYHVPGVRNPIADALSRQLLQTAVDKIPGLIIRPFSLPGELIASHACDVVPRSADTPAGV